MTIYYGSNYAPLAAGFQPPRAGTMPVRAATVPAPTMLDNESNERARRTRSNEGARLFPRAAQPIRPRTRHAH